MATSSAAPSGAHACSRHALGTARTVTVDPKEFPRIGTTQYSNTLPLNDREVVLTFDDGPARPFTEAVLKALAEECVKATFFLVGRQAQAHPDLVRAIAQAGHSIGTHSQNHPLTFDQMPLERTQSEIDDGIASVASALGEAPAPFFRIPGFLRSREIEQHLAAREIALWSTDFDADDWYRTATPDDIVRKAMQRIEAKKRGVLLLHDVQPATALAVPMLLKELKARGYRIVHAVPVQQHRAAPVAARKQPAPRIAAQPHWPRTASARDRDDRRVTQERPAKIRTETRARPKVRYLTRREWEEMNRRQQAARYATRGWDDRGAPYRR